MGEVLDFIKWFLIGVGVSAALMLAIPFVRNRILHRWP